MSNYSKNLSGLNQKVVVAAYGVEYTSQATISAFIDNAAEGEIGVFLNDGTLRTTALTAGLKFQVVQKRDGLLNKTPIINWDDLSRKLRTVYAAPVRKVVTIGYPGSGTTDIQIDSTGASPTNTLTFGIAARETTPGNQPFPVQEGYATSNSATADEYSILASIVSQLNGDYDYEREQPDRFVKAEILSNGTLTALGQTAAVVNGSVSVTAGAAVTLADRSFLSLAGVIYRVNGAVSASTAIIIDRPYQGATATLASGTGATQAATAAYTSGTTLLGVRLTGLTDSTHFTVAGNQGLTLAPVVVQTQWLLGSGSGASIAELEKEGRFFDGVGSPVNAAFAADYGLPTLFANSVGTYNQFFLDFVPSITPSAALPTYRQVQIERVLIAVGSSGTTPDNELQTIFGL